MRLRCNQVCPIHRSFSCCGREAVQKTRPARQLGVRRIEDPSHLRGYREFRSNGEMRMLVNGKIVSQNGKCGSAVSVVPSSRTIAISCQTTSARGEWAGHGEMITRIISRLLTGGATGRRDPQGPEP
jgi:hypothetical protein